MLGYMILSFIGFKWIDGISCNVLAPSMAGCHEQGHNFRGAKINPGKS